MPYLCILQVLHSSSVRIEVQREKMWGNYHSVPASCSYRERWIKLLQQIPECEACPIFYQFLTNHIFKNLIKQHFPVADEQSSNEELDLSCEEENALRYAAGYVCRAMKKKLGTNDSNMMECINDLTGDGEESLDPSREWIKLASRGGLLHIKDNV